MLRRIFGPKREENELWRKLHNDELYSLYPLPRWVGHVARMGGGERCLQGFGWEVRRGETTGKN